MDEAGTSSAHVVAAYSEAPCQTRPLGEFKERGAEVPARVPGFLPPDWCGGRSARYININTWTAHLYVGGLHVQPVGALRGAGLS